MGSFRKNLANISCWEDGFRRGGSHVLGEFRVFDAQGTVFWRGVGGRETNTPANASSASFSVGISVSVAVSPSVAEGVS